MNFNALIAAVPAVFVGGWTGGMGDLSAPTAQLDLISEDCE